MPGRVAVVADTTCCLTTDEVGAAGVGLVDLEVVLDGRASPESQVTVAEVADVMRRRRRVSTSSPLPARFLQAYQAARDAGAEQVVSVHLAARASGTVNIARMAARQVDLPVHVVDTGQLGRATGAAVLAAAAAAAADRGVAEVVAAAELTAARCRTVFCVDDLEHLRRGGRLSTTQTLIGSALAVKPLLIVRDGLVDVLEKVRTSTRARARLVTLGLDAVRDADGPSAVFVHHVDAVDPARALAGQLESRLPVDVEVVETSPVIAAHVGPGALGVVVCPG